MLALFKTQFVQASDLLVFDVKKTLRLKDSDPQYKDFYINGGEEYGLRPGMLVTVYRKVGMYDALRNKSAGELKVFVGRLKVIHVQNGLAVARVYSKLSRKKLPILNYNAIMVGDRLDMDTAEMDRGKKKKIAKVQKKPHPIKEEVERVSFSSTLPQKAVNIPQMQ